MGELGRLSYCLCFVSESVTICRIESPFIKKRTKSSIGTLTSSSHWRTGSVQTKSQICTQTCIRICMHTQIHWEKKS